MKTLSDEKVKDKDVFDAGSYIYCETSVADFITNLKDFFNKGCEPWENEDIEAVIDKFAGQRFKTERSCEE